MVEELQTLWDKLPHNNKAPEIWPLPPLLKEPPREPSKGLLDTWINIGWTHIYYSM